MKLAQRFNFLVIPLVALPLLSFGILSYDRFFKDSRQQYDSRVQSVVSRLTQQLDQALLSATATTELLAADLTMRQYALIEDDADRYAIYQGGLLNRFRVFLESDTRQLEVRFLLADGYEDARWGRSGVRNNTDEEGHHWWFNSLSDLDREHTHFIDTNVDTGRLALYIFRPIRLADVATQGVNAPPRLRGYIGVTVDLDWLEAEMATISQEADLLLVFFSSAGKQLISSMGPEPFGKPDFLDQLESTVAAEGTDRFEGMRLRGEKYVGDISVSSNGYSFMGIAPAEEIYLGARELSREMILITLAAILAAIIFSSYFLRKVIITPLRRMIDASNEIGSGKLGTHISEAGGGEFRELAESFNRMAKDLARSDEKIRYIAHHDTLTQLPNRHLFQLYLNKSIASARRENTELALLFLDIDHFKTINDTLGHAKGDELLRLFADKIGTCIREEDFVGLVDRHGDGTEDLLARHGGDEFTIILPRVDGSRSAALVAQRILDSLTEDFVLDGQTHRISTSIGITMYPRDGGSLEALLRCADIAMYHAKDQGRNNYQFYSQDMMQRILDRIEGESELRKAIRNGDMCLHYQPQIGGPLEELYGFEALVRWEHAERGTMSPFSFIKLAEETGLIVEIGSWVMQEACRQAARWLAEGFAQFSLSVNVSGVQFAKQDVAGLIRSALDESCLNGQHLTVELTESILMTANEDTWEQLRKIQAMGVSIALDDFGTGYSSLSYLRSFPVDILKIDRSFIVESENNAEVRAIVTAIVDMAKALNLKVVAEGVEKPAQLSFLRSINCDVIQGYYYARPMPAEEVPEFVQQRASNCGDAISVA